MLLLTVNFSFFIFSLPFQYDIFPGFKVAGAVIGIDPDPVFIQDINVFAIGHVTGYI